MNITIIGTGYVGLPSGVGFAELGHNVICVDREKTKIDLLKSGTVTLYEERLEELLQKNLSSGNIKFTTSMEYGVKNADIIIIAVGTPPHPVTHEADMQYVHAAAIELARYLSKYTVIATKSTVPVGTGDVIESLIRKSRPDADFDVVSLPEFLREGKAIHDFFNPDRIIVGTESDRAFELIKNLYNDQTKNFNIIKVTRRSSELIKYASNSFLAIKIHYINEIADLCESTDANIKEVALGIGMDSRIGNKFLNPGPGFGGSCFPKDTLALSYIAKQNSVSLSLVDAAIKGNEERQKRIARQIVDKVIENGEKLGILGLSFKAGTDDCRESPAIKIIMEILNLTRKHEVIIGAYDPQAENNAKLILGDEVVYEDTIEAIFSNYDTIAILTEWEEFASYVTKNKKHLDKTIIDTRFIL